MHKLQKSWAGLLLTRVHDLVFRKNILARYLVAGGVGASTNIGLLFLCTDIFKIWYLYSSVIAFSVAVFVSFVLQKFWTFGDRQIEKVHNQFVLYLIGALVGLGINATLMYIFVEYFGIWYIAAQIITGVFIAILNFLIYRFIVFKKRIPDHE